MYIKLTFQVQAGRVGAEASAAVAELVQYPSVIEGLEAVPDINQAMENNQYVKEPVVSMFQDGNTSLKTFYLNCGEKSQQVVNKALELFNKHYETKQSGLPMVVWGGDSPEQNEIIRNMRHMLNNAVLLLQMHPYETDFAIQKPAPEQQESFCNIL